MKVRALKDQHMLEKIGEHIERVKTEKPAMTG